MAIHIKPSNRGKLRKALHTPAGRKIPRKALTRAAHSKNETLRKRAQFAINMRKVAARRKRR